MTVTRGTLPCTALTFVKNSAASLELCLKSGLFCAEHLLLDGGSTDGTLELAKEYGCRVVPQDKQFLNAEGRIIDYAGITNQGLALATHKWITIIDSDEYLDQTLIDEMTRCVQADLPGAFFVNRLYTLNGDVVEYASTYPNTQIRLWHADAITKFIKIVHERPQLKPGVRPSILPGVQYVPLDPPEDMRRKFLRYLDLEVKKTGHDSWSQWFTIVSSKVPRMFLKVLRILGLRILHPFSRHLPLSYERLHLWYPWVIIVRTCPLSRGS